MHARHQSTYSLMAYGPQILSNPEYTHTLNTVRTQSLGLYGLALEWHLATGEARPYGHICLTSLDCSKGGKSWAKKGVPKAETFLLEWSRSAVPDIWMARVSGPRILPCRSSSPLLDVHFWAWSSGVGKVSCHFHLYHSRMFFDVMPPERSSSCHVIATIVLQFSQFSLGLKKEIKLTACI